MRAALLKEGASRHQKTGVISSPPGTALGSPFFWMICSAWGRAVPSFLPQAALQEAREPVSGPSILRPGRGEDHRAGMVPRRPLWGKMTTRCAALLRTGSPANRGKCAQVPPADPGFASSPPAWSWAWSGFLGWVVPVLLPRTHPPGLG